MDKINFILDNIPDNYNKEKDSNLYKILDSISGELDNFVSYTDEVKNAKFVDYAKGSDLDKIGSILNLKRFANENDSNFRSRIKSKVPSFIGGGTISSIKQVVNNYLGIEPVIIEHYKPGEGHALFDNGVLNGLNLQSVNSTTVKINAGTAYIEGGRASFSEVNQTISTGNQYIKYSLINEDTKFINNYVGKIIGSNVENPNIAKILASSTLSAPASFVSEFSQAGYDNIEALDGTIGNSSTSTLNNYSQQLFGFNIIEILQNKFGSGIWQGKVTLAEKVAIAKTIIKSWTFNWRGYGSSPLGNKAYISVWGGSWVTIKSHTNGTVSLLSIPSTSTTFIMSDGYIYFNAYADASDGTTTSTIRTDYVELQLGMKLTSFVNVETDNVLKSNQILLGLANGITITDMRNILNPEEHYITNTASITVQIPFTFSIGNISLEDVKDILRNTKAAGVALLIKVMETYNDSIDVTDNINPYFLVGYSSIGGNNLLGGV